MEGRRVFVSGADEHPLCMGTYFPVDVPKSIHNHSRQVYQNANGKYLYYWDDFGAWRIGENYRTSNDFSTYFISEDFENSDSPADASSWYYRDGKRRMWIFCESISVTEESLPITVAVVAEDFVATNIGGEVVAQIPCISGATLQNARKAIKEKYDGRRVSLVTIQGSLLDEVFDSVELVAGIDFDSVVESSRSTSMDLENFADVIVEGAEDLYPLFMGTYSVVQVKSVPMNAGRQIYKNTAGKYLYYWGRFQAWRIGDDYRTSSDDSTVMLSLDNEHTQFPADATGWLYQEKNTRKYVKDDNIAVFTQVAYDAMKTS